MDSNNCLCFIASWYDAQADHTKEFYLNYYMDATLELVDKKTNKIFLKRIKYTGIKEAELFIGGVVTIYSRQLNLMNYANEYTRLKLDNCGERGTILILPDGYKCIGKILSIIEKNHVSIVTLKSISLQKYQVNEIIQMNTLKNLPSDRFIQSGYSVAIEIVAMNTQQFEKLMQDMEYYGFIENLCYIRNISYFFHQNQFRTTAEFYSCTTCILRPRILKNGKTGEIINEILENGEFHITSLELFRLDSTQAEEFFEAYKGVVKHYHELIQYMSSGPCLVLAITCPNEAVQKFREFCGPFDVDVARKLRPSTIRAKYGKSNLMNAVHCTDCPEDGEIETSYFFETLQVT